MRFFCPACPKNALNESAAPYTKTETVKAYKCKGPLMLRVLSPILGDVCGLARGPVPIWHSLLRGEPTCFRLLPKLKIKQLSIKTNENCKQTLISEQKLHQPHGLRESYGLHWLVIHRQRAKNRVALTQTFNKTTVILGVTCLQSRSETPRHVTLALIPIWKLGAIQVKNCFEVRLSSTSGV